MSRFYLRLLLYTYEYHSTDSRVSLLKVVFCLDGLEGNLFVRFVTSETCKVEFLIINIFGATTFLLASCCLVCLWIDSLLWF